MPPQVQYGRSATPIPADRHVLLGQQLAYVSNLAMRIGTVANAEKLGYHKNYHRIDGRGFEYANFHYMNGTFNIAHPFMLVFDGDQPDSPIVSVAYNVTGTEQAGPPKYFPLELIPWHWHYDLCSVGESIVASNSPDRCKKLHAIVHPELNHWMVDLWVVPGWENPWGLVSSKNPDLFPTPEPWYADPATHGAGMAGMAGM